MCSETSKIAMPKLVNSHRTGRPGRPRKDIDPQFLKTAMDPRYRLTKAKMARKLGINRKTFSKNLRRHAINSSYIQISNTNLDKLVRDYRDTNPHVGVRYLVGHLKVNGYWLPRWRINDSIARVDGLGQTLRRRKGIRRGKYSVPRPNYLWHINGHHKLILWGFVIHGCVDGFWRTVCDY